METTGIIGGLWGLYIYIYIDICRGLRALRFGASQEDA